MHYHEKVFEPTALAASQNAVPQGLGVCFEGRSVFRAAPATKSTTTTNTNNNSNSNSNNSNSDAAAVSAAANSNNNNNAANNVAQVVRALPPPHGSACS
jgi:hypothetical protein